MTITTVPASQGSATFSDLNITVNLTVPNTLTGDIVEIIDNSSLAVLGSAIQAGTTESWRAALKLPSNTSTVNLSARTKRVVSSTTSGVAHRYWRFYIFSCSNSYEQVGLSLFVMKTTSSGPNLSITGNGTASASSSGAGPASSAFDGSTYDIWGTTNNTTLPGWLMWDFGIGNGQDIRYIEVTNGGSIGTPISAVLQFSDDAISFTDWMPYSGTATAGAMTATTYTPPFTYSDKAAPPFAITYQAPPTLRHRYWQLYMTAGNISQNVIALTGFEMRTTVNSTGVNLSITGNGTSFADAGESFLAFDNNNDTSWYSQGLYPVSIGWDFGATNPLDIKSCSICNSPSAGTASYSLKDALFQWSDDKITWTTLITITGHSITPGEVKLYTAN